MASAAICRCQFLRNELRLRRGRGNSQPGWKPPACTRQKIWKTVDR